MGKSDVVSDLYRPHMSIYKFLFSKSAYYHIAAHCYIKGGGLQEGEKLVFVNGIQRKCLREWQGQTCKYVAVKYTFRKANGNLDQRIIHLLMTEHCDSIIDCCYDGKAEWVKDDDLLILRDIFPHGVFGGER